MSPGDLRVAAQLLGALDQDARGVISLPPQDREAIEATLTSRYRTALADKRLFVGPFSLLGVTHRHRRLADDLLRRHAPTAAGSSPRKSATVDTMVTRAAAAPHSEPWYELIAISLIGLMTGLFVVATLSLVDAITWRGGVMRIVGLELVTADGRPASRGRVLSRAALTWGPLLLPALIVFWGLGSSETTASASIALTPGADSDASGSALESFGVSRLMLVVAPVSFLVLLAGAIVAINNPARGVQDRLAGTWIVPR